DAAPRQVTLFSRLAAFAFLAAWALGQKGVVCSKRSIFTPGLLTSAVSDYTRQVMEDRRVWFPRSLPISTNWLGSSKNRESAVWLWRRPASIGSCHMTCLSSPA